MFPHKTIYKAGKSPLHGEINLHPGKILKLGYHLARGIGSGLIAFAIVGFIFTFYPLVNAELTHTFKKPAPVVSEVVPVKATEEDKVKTEAEALSLDPWFSLYVPSIDAKSRIIPNVNAGNSKEYQDALMQGVAHAAGTSFPGQGKVIYMFSHSTDSPLNFARYNAVFYLLKDVKEGDVITVFFLNRKYQYKVTLNYVTSATDASIFTDDGSGEKLVLQTCDPPGTSWRRRIVVARPI